MIQGQVSRNGQINYVPETLPVTITFRNNIPKIYLGTLNIIPFSTYLY